MMCRMARGKRRSETRPVSACAERGRARSSRTRRARVVATDRGASGAEGRDPPSSARRVRSSRSERSSVGPGDAWDGARAFPAHAPIAVARSRTGALPRHVRVSLADPGRVRIPRAERPARASGERPGTSRLGSGKLKSRAGPGAGDAFAPAEGLLGAHGQDGGAEASHLSCRLGEVGCRTEVECASMAPSRARALPIKSGMRANARSRMPFTLAFGASSALIGRQDSGGSVA